MMDCADDGFRRMATAAIAGKSRNIVSVFGLRGIRRILVKMITTEVQRSQTKVIRHRSK